VELLRRLCLDATGRPQMPAGYLSPAVPPAFRTTSKAGRRPIALFTRTPGSWYRHREPLFRARLGGLGKTVWPKRAERLSLSPTAWFGLRERDRSAPGPPPGRLATLAAPPPAPEQTALNAIHWAERCELLRSRQAGLTDTECGRGTAEQRER
jgi:hypothetical protein